VSELDAAYHVASQPIRKLEEIEPEVDFIIEKCIGKEYIPGSQHTVAILAKLQDLCKEDAKWLGDIEYLKQLVLDGNALSKSI
jgi:hypothetical protein